MNASMIKKRIFAFALTFLLATQMFAPGAAMQVLADELGAPSSGPVALAASESEAAPLAPEASADPAPSEEAVPEESQPEAPDALPAEKDAPSSQEAAPVAEVSVELVTPSVNDTADVVLKKAAAAAGVETDYGGLTISGGTAGADYALETVAYTRIGRGSNEDSQYQDGRRFPTGSANTQNISMLVIKQNGTYTIRNTAGAGTAVSTGIRVAPGVHANIVFAGVNINSKFPMDIATNSHVSGNGTSEVSEADVANKTTVHITLADGTANTLYNSNFATKDTGSNDTSAAQFPGLRCGEGSVLVIDDAVTNVDTSGNPITPEQGMIPAGVSYVSKEGTVKTSTGKGSDLASSLSNLESANPGSLAVYSGVRSAAIGGGPIENSGDMTFNGGNIRAYAQDPGAIGGNPSGNGSGCGIGGGHAGGGTATTFNGGTVDASASYHGAAIGGGCTYTGGMSRSTTTYPLRDALISRTANHTIAGDITINGGYIKAQGYYHSNAFGQGCGGTNTGHTILITGGTLEPGFGGNPSFLEIGGNQGYVVITGGSVKCTPGRFQGNDNDGLAYGDLEHKTKVSMMTVNVAPKIESMASEAGVTPNLNAHLESWELLLDKFPTTPPYGAPASFLQGKLYLWLPAGTNQDHQIDANFHYYVGDKLLSSNTTLPSGSSGSGDTVAKEWEHFTLDETFIKQNWSKYYDGEALTPVDVQANPIRVENPAGGSLNDNKAIKYNFQQVNEDGEALSAAVTGSHTPSDAGLYEIEVRSDQYHNNTTFAQTYWGHSATGQAVIYPVCSATTAEVKQGVTLTYTDQDGNQQSKTYTAPTWAQDDNAGNFNAATNNHLVVPVDITSGLLPDGSGTMSSAKCKAPTGRLQLYIDGRKVSEAHGGVIELTRQDMEDAKAANQWIEKDDAGREHSMAYFNLTRSQLEAFGLADKSGQGNEHTVLVEYTSAKEGAAPRDTQEDEPAGPSDLKKDGPGEPFTPAHNDSAYVNYYESDTGESVVQIDLAVPDFKLFNEDGTGYVPNGEGLEDSQQAANDAKLKLDEAHERDVVVKEGDNDKRTNIRDDIEVKSFRDETDADGNVTATHQDWFPLYVQTNSIGDIEFTSSNPTVISIEPNDFTANRTYVENKTDYGVAAKAKVLSAGKTTITATLKGTGAFSGATKSFDVYVFPDLAKKPELSITQTTYDTTREDGTIRPGDVLRTVVKVTNTTPDSACIDPVVTISVPADAIFKKLVAVDPLGNEIDLTDQVKDRIKDGVVTVDSLTTIFGEETYTLKMDVEVKTSVVDSANPDRTPQLTSESSAKGIYGVNKDQFDWDNRLDKDGNPVDKVTAAADPTTPDPNPADPKDPVKEVEDILGGDLIDPTPDPDNPPTDPVKPGVPVDKVTPGSPLDDARKPLPTDPSNPDADPKPDPDSPEPIKPDDRIVKIGDKDDPKTPEDIAKEVEEQIKKKREEDPEADHVDIPVVIERDDPANPDGDPEQITVIVTVPIPKDDPSDDPAKDPDDRDDHDLVVVPTDPDPDAGDISITKTWANATAGADKRANQEIVQVGDQLLYTITLTNSKAGSAYYGAKVVDELPAGMEYIPGSIEVTTNLGAKLTQDDFTADYNAASRKLYIAVGHIYGGESAIATFKVKVTSERLNYNEPQTLPNVARAFGTKPTDTVKDPEPDPDDPDHTPELPKEIKIPDGTPGPFGDENPPADDPADKDRDPEKPADITLVYTVKVKKVADDAEKTAVSREELLGTLRDLAKADGHDLSSTPQTLDFHAKESELKQAAADASDLAGEVTGDESTALTATGESTLTTTFVRPSGAKVTAVLHHIVWDEEGGEPEDKPDAFSADTQVSENISKGTITQEQLFERALNLAQSKGGLNIPVGMKRQDFKLMRQSADGQWVEVGADEPIDLSQVGAYKFEANYAREASDGVRAMAGPLSLTYGLFKSGPQSESGPGTSGPIAPSDPDPAKVQVSKESANTTPHEDGQVHVGDLLSYEITVSNEDEPSTCCYDLVISDELPEGLEVVSGSLKMILPGGAEKEVPDSVYDPLSHSLSVYGGYLKGGETIKLRFDVQVAQEAEGKDIGNHAVASYVNPSDSTTATIFGTEPRPEPGEPAKTSDFANSLSTDPTPAAYPNDATGPVLPAEVPVDAANTLKPAPAILRHILPKTGDVASAAGWLGALAAAAVAATAAVWRKRRHEA